MRFKDEKYMWYADTEILAAKLANKSKREVQRILDDHDVIKLNSCDRPKLKWFNRLSWIVLIPFFMLLFIIKWFITGDGHLDTWFKKSKILNYLYNFTGA